MARALLDAPLGLLLLQAEHTKGHLRTLTSVRGAMAKDGVDVCALEAELITAAEDGRAAQTALGDAELDEERLQRRMGDLAERARSWVAELRRRLGLIEVVAPRSAKAAEAVRRRLRKDQRTFGKALASLRDVVPLVRSHEPALTAAFNGPALFDQADALLREAEQLDEERSALDTRLYALRQKRDEERDRLVLAFRHLRRAWDAARAHHTADLPVPPMSMAVLEEAREVSPEPPPELTR